MNIERIIRELTIEEKVALVAGTDFMFTNPVRRLGIPSLRMSDGPHGLRVQKEGGDNGVSASEPATSFPTAATVASSWEPENARKMGAAIGKEAHKYGIHVVLGPGANIKRNPLAGRNFEYFSEDPYLAGKMAAAEVRGIQSEGVGVSVKHFALNNAENFRFMGNSVADERAIREIYLKVFEMIVKEAHPVTMMCAYNKINGEYCCENKWLLTDVLRKEWGFVELVMTDWGAMHDRVKSLKAGLDLEMPGDTAICRKWILDGVEDGSLSMQILDEAVKNVLTLVEQYVRSHPDDCDFEANDRFACEIAEDSAVLLKNDGILPLDEKEKLFVCGDLFEKMRYQGAGSSMINPTKLTTPKDAFDAMGVRYTYARGYVENSTATNGALLREALEGAKQFQKVLVFAGLTDYVESEGCDREDMRLPENQLVLIEGLIGEGKQVIVVLFGGSPVELPFAGKEVVQLYVSAPESNVYKPLRELRAFQKVRLAAGEEKEVSLTVNKDELRYFDVQKHAWTMEGGEYRFELCSDASTVVLEQAVILEGEHNAPYPEDVLKVYQDANLEGLTDEVFEQMSGHHIPPLPAKKPITLESRFSNLEKTGFLGKILHSAVLSVATKQMKEAKKLPEGKEKDNKIKGAFFLRRILESNSLISMSMSAGKTMPYNFACGFMELANGHLLKGIKCFCTAIKVPKLPKEKDNER